jgi:hypothetical protein
MAAAVPETPEAPETRQLHPAGDWESIAEWCGGTLHESRSLDTVISIDTKVGVRYAGCGDLITREADGTFSVTKGHSTAWSTQ